MHSIEVNNIIVEAQTKKIILADDFRIVITDVLQSNQKTILFAIYTHIPQRKYIDVKLDVY